MDLNLDGKAAVVTGASKGIGLAVVRALVAEGARVTAGARQLGELPDGVRPIQVDLSTPDGPAYLVEEAAAAYGRLDLLVNTVGGAVGLAPEAVQKKAAGDSVTGRFTTPDEVAALVVMAASDRIGNVTGTDFILDGGLVSTL
jgi:NAD(P)-dependent dehydrogenase (short-subunit alcohol dehydrogenase family)